MLPKNDQVKQSFHHSTTKDCEIQIFSSVLVVNMKKGNFKDKLHIYEVQNFKFNERDDVDLVKYKEITVNQLSIGQSSSFKMPRSSIGGQLYESKPKMFKVAEPFKDPQEATKALLVGLKHAIEKINKNIQRSTGDKNFHIDTSGFKVYEYAKIQSCTDQQLFFPVEAKICVTVNDASFEIFLNLDNPTSLSCGNQESGCQGSHFGYTIVKKCDGSRTRGHILLTTFVGFPSRDEGNSSKDSKSLSLGKFCDIALKDGPLPFDITTDKGIRSANNNENLYQSERVKRLPNELIVLHNTFLESQFIFPDTTHKMFSSYCDC